jgi:mRNA-degrading endonuclease YafQ of YafQ-DinJ toxin-antitoxin module
MIFARSDRFKENYAKLNDDIKKKVRDKLKLMAENPMHPSLRTKKIQGTEKIFGASINMSVRLTWQYIENGILLRNIGEHDETLKNP